MKKLISLMLAATIFIIANVSVSAEAGIVHAQINPPDIPGSVVPGTGDGGIPAALKSIYQEYPHGSYFTTTGTDCTSEHLYCKEFDGGTQCDGFARYVYYKLRGKTYNSQKNNIKNVNKDSSNVKDILRGLPLGTYIRLRTSTRIDHSVIVAKTTDSGIILYHANYDGKCMVSYSYYSWSSFVSAFPYIYHYLQ